MITWLILAWLFSWFLVQDQWNVSSCSMQAVSHCMNLEAWWNATKWNDLWKQWQKDYWFSDLTGADIYMANTFARSLGNSISEYYLWFSEIYPIPKLDQKYISNIKNILASWNKILLAGELNWISPGSWNIISRSWSLQAHEVCVFDSVDQWLIFVNSWWKRVQFWLIKWDDLFYARIYIMNWDNPKKEPKYLNLKVKKNLQK